MPEFFSSFQTISVLSLLSLSDLQEVTNFQGLGYCQEELNAKQTNESEKAEQINAI